MLRAENISDHEADVGKDTSFPNLSENGNISKLIQGWGNTPVRIRNIYEKRFHVDSREVFKFLWQL